MLLKATKSELSKHTKKASIFHSENSYLQIYIFMNLTELNIVRFFPYDTTIILKTSHLILHLFHFMNFPSFRYFTIHCPISTIRSLSMLVRIPASPSIFKTLSVETFPVAPFA